MRSEKLFKRWKPEWRSGSCCGSRRISSERRDNFSLSIRMKSSQRDAGQKTPERAGAITEYKLDMSFMFFPRDPQFHGFVERKVDGHRAVVGDRLGQTIVQVAERACEMRRKNVRPVRIARAL